MKKLNKKLALTAIALMLLAFVQIMFDVFGSLLGEKARVPRFGTHDVSTEWSPPVTTGGVPPSSKEDSHEHSERSVLLQGICVAESGVGIPGVVVALARREEQYVSIASAQSAGMATLSDAEGHFEVSIPESGLTTAYALIARHREYQATVAEIPAHPRDGAMTVVMRSGMTISGTVVARDGQPLRSVRVVARGRKAGLEVLRPDVLAGPGVQFAQTLSDAAGRFTLSGLSASMYLVDAYGPGLRRVEPQLYGQSVYVQAGATVDFVLEAAALLHIRALDALDETPIADARFSPNARDLQRVRFSPGATYLGSHAALPPLYGPPGVELCLFGFDREILPGGSDSDGRFIVAGHSMAWPISQSSSIEVVVSAPGYDTESIEATLHPLSAGIVPEADVVRLHRNGDYLDKGEITLAVLDKAGAPIRNQMVNVVLWRKQSPEEVRNEVERQKRSEHPDLSARVFVPPEAGSGLSEEQRRELGVKILEAQHRASRDHLATVSRVVRLGDDGLGVIDRLPEGSYYFAEYCGLEGEPFRVVAGGTLRVTATEKHFGSVSLLRRPGGGKVRVRFEALGELLTQGVGFRLTWEPRDEDGATAPPYWNGEEILPPGASLGNAPLEMTLPTGRYTLAAYGPGWKDQVVGFEVSGLGEIREVVVQLSEADQVVRRGK